MFKKRYSRPGAAPATLHAMPDASPAVVIKLMEYDRDGCNERIVDSVAALPDCRTALNAFCLPCPCCGRMQATNAPGARAGAGQGERGSEM